MKQVIRHNVFETNSSSSHSVTFGDYNWSAPRKLAFLICLINEVNAKSWDFWDVNPQLKDIKENDFDEILKNLDLDINNKLENDNDQSLKNLNSCKNNEDDTCGINFIDYRKLVIEFRDKAIAEYCKRSNKTKEEVEEEIRLVMENETEKTKAHRLNISQKDLSVANCSWCFFSEGAMEDCDCGFGNCKLIAVRLNIKDFDNIDEAVNNFLDDKKGFFIEEKYPSYTY